MDKKPPFILTILLLATLACSLTGAPTPSLPDPAETLRADPRYAIRFANEGIWDAAHGWNVLGKVRVGE
jgi:hypothetical protein